MLPMIRELQLAVLASTVLLTPHVPATERTEVALPATAQSSTIVGAPALSPAELHDRRVMHDELEARMRLTRQQVADLEKRSEATTDVAFRDAVQRHIEASKREGALELFRIQLRHAQSRGRNEQVTELQAILDRAALEKLAPLAPLPAAPARVAPASKPAKAVTK